MPGSCRTVVNCTTGSAAPSGAQSDRLYGVASRFERGRPYLKPPPRKQPNIGHQA